jgi:hypothetical protein
MGGRLVLNIAIANDCLVTSNPCLFRSAANPQEHHDPTPNRVTLAFATNWG